MSTPKSSSTPGGASPIRCCFPVSGLWKCRKRTIKGKRSVRFQSQIVSPVTMKSLGRSRSGKSSCYYSAVSALSRMDEIDDDLQTSASGGENPCCICEHPAHSRYDPAFPMVLCEGWTGGCYEELLAHALAVEGKWVTVLERSESLDPQMVHVGLSKMKRMVMNRLAIPLEAVLDAEKRVLKLWIETPVGNKYTHASLVGEELEDKDGDLGDWTSSTHMVDYTTPLYCGGTSFRAMQLERQNPKFGTAYETRAVLPDKEFGQIFLYSIHILPPNNGKEIKVTRVYKRR